LGGGGGCSLAEMSTSEQGMTSQNTSMFSNPAVRTSNFALRNL
jgi:hypothetical protein